MMRQCTRIIRNPRCFTLPNHWVSIDKGPPRFKRWNFTIFSKWICKMQQVLHCFHDCIPMWPQSNYYSLYLCPLWHPLETPVFSSKITLLRNLWDMYICLCLPLQQSHFILYIKQSKNLKFWKIASIWNTVWFCTQDNIFCTPLCTLAHLGSSRIMLDLCLYVHLV